MAWYEIDSRSRYLWHRLGYDDEPLLAGATQGRVHSYIAASRQLEGAENLRTRMREAFAAMIADGTWQRILSGYFSEERRARCCRRSRWPARRCLAEGEPGYQACLNQSQRPSEKFGKRLMPSADLIR